MGIQHNNEATPHGKPSEHQGHYVLELFKFIGDQRLKTFNYYALILVVTTGGTFTAVEKFSHEVLLLCGVTHVVVATVFWLIDKRNCQLISIASVELALACAILGKGILGSPARTQVIRPAPRRICDT